MFTRKQAFILAAEFMFIGFLIGYLAFHTRPEKFSHRGKGGLWSIGIYAGDSPFMLYSDRGSIKNPVLTAEDVTDVKAKFLADPLMVKESNKWYLFFEVFNDNTKNTEIGLAESDNGLKWNYKQIVLRESFGLSYPYVFKYNGEYYMIPECHLRKHIKLYKASAFPYSWKFYKNIISGDYADPSFFMHEDKCWMFASSNDSTLHLFYSDSLTDGWKEHPKSPVVAHNANIARCGGKVISYQNKLYRFPQDDLPFYGSQVRCFEITKLSLTEYEESEIHQSPVLRPSRVDYSWNGRCMHTYDVHEVSPGFWIASVDGL